MRYSEAPEGIRIKCMDSIDRRRRQLIEWTGIYFQKSIQFLFITNAGGAVAILGFIGASAWARNNYFIKISLLSFAIGIIASGMMLFTLLIHTANLLRQLDQNISNFFNNKTSWEKFVKSDDERTRKEKITGLFMVIAFNAFLTGIYFGTRGLFN